LLLNAGVKVDAFGKSALRVASGIGHEGIVRLLLGADAGAVINSPQTSYRGTALKGMVMRE
jgi:hypothetical protein